MLQSFSGEKQILIANDPRNKNNASVSLYSDIGILFCIILNTTRKRIPILIIPPRLKLKYVALDPNCEKAVKIDNNGNINITKYITRSRSGSIKARKIRPIKIIIVRIGEMLKRIQVK